MLSLLDRGSTVDDWIEDLLSTPSWITFIHRPVRVFVRWSQFLSDRLRREPIIVAHLLCTVLFCAICVYYVLRFQSRTFVVKRLLLIKPKLKIRRIRVGA